jgi:hypothetical protein
MKLTTSNVCSEPEVSFKLVRDGNMVSVVGIFPNGETHNILDFELDERNNKILMGRFRLTDVAEYFNLTCDGYICTAAEMD